MKISVNPGKSISVGTTTATTTTSLLLAWSGAALAFPHRPEPNGWRSVLSGFSGSVSHNFGVDSTGHTVQQLGVQFGKSIHFIDASIGNISDSRSFHNVPDHK